ncbi:hypothetical protein RP20_CCG007830 [Aedes albopictus]|nr:hypothetical protein RP20_CCG007830 [Aedes albopictus]
MGAEVISHLILLEVRHWCRELVLDQVQQTRSKSTFRQNILTTITVNNKFTQMEELDENGRFVVNSGLTQLDIRPASTLQYALPDLANLGSSWVFPITRTVGNSAPKSSILGEGINVRTSRGVFPRNLLRPMSQDGGGSADILPTDTHSRIGIIFVPTPNEADKAEMHFIINGEDQGPCTQDIPYTKGALHVVIDVYGTTKQVKIIQLYGISTLQSACRDAILSRVSKTAIRQLPLPESLKEYLLQYAP